MKKRLILSFIMPFLFMILSSFGYQQDPVGVEKKTNSDSLTVNLKFQNPELILNDARTFDAFKQFQQNKDQTESEVATALESISKELSEFLPYIVESQERRYESAMDYLSRTYNVNFEEIDKYIKQKRATENISSVVLMTFILISLVLLYYLSSQGLDWRKFTLVFVATIGGLLTISFLLKSIITIFYHEMQDFFTLVNLSG